MFSISALSDIYTYAVNQQMHIEKIHILSMCVSWFTAEVQKVS